MRELTRSEAAQLDKIAPTVDDFVLVHATATGIAKSTFDATREIRDFPIRSRTHSYERQGRGPENKRVLSVDIISRGKTLAARSISFNRPRSGNGDPSFWVAQFNQVCNDNSVFVLALTADDLLIKILDQQFNSSPNPMARDDTGASMSDPCPQSEPTRDWYRDVGQLWNRATGGADVAAMPDTGSEYWETSPRPAGVEAATQWFRSRFESPTPTLLFLIGGPGAGKSHTAASLVNDLDMTSKPEEGLANRSYKYISSTGTPVRLVNDATIPESDNARSALHSDIDEVLEEHGSLIACVNRGVLIEELLSAESDSGKDFGVSAAIIPWLTEAVPNSNNLQVQIKKMHVDSDFLRGCQVLQNGTIVAEVVAVSVDVCSLLEETPVTTFTGSEILEESFKTTNYGVTDFTKRDALSEERVPALDLLRGVVLKLDPAPEISDLLNPIAANIQSLSHPAIRHGLVSALRASEVVAAQRMTYRELWGAVVRSIAGGSPGQVSPVGIAEYLKSKQPMSDDPSERFVQSMELADLRISQAIFAREDSRSGSYDPVLHLTSRVDPVLDARPGNFEKDNWTSGWSTPITEAFDTPINDATPLQGLRASLQGEDPFHLIVTLFDEALDTAYSEAIANIGNDKPRAIFAARYGAYLTRLYAIANGITAFRPEISLWTRTRVMAPHLPDHLKANMRTLLRPSRRPESPNSASVLPVFASRTDPIIGRSAEPRFGLRTESIQMKTHASSDEVIMTLLEEGIDVASVTLDFDLVREALACDAHRPGITELTETVSPRLERFRSARLISSRLNEADFCAVIDDREVQVSVEVE